jgi:hypothetical protein
MGILARVGGFGPLVGALAALTAADRSVRTWLRSNLRVRIPVRWYAWALVLPPLLVGVAGVVFLFIALALLDGLARAHAGYTAALLADDGTA